MNTPSRQFVFASIAGTLICGATNAFAQQAPSRGSSGSQVLRTFGPTNALGALASSETSVRFWSRTGSKVRIEGTSTFRDWAAEGSMINGYLELDPHFPNESTATVEVEIPVGSLLSVKGIKNQVIYEALKQRQYPKIAYRLKDISLKPIAQPEPLQFDAVGELSVAGMLGTNAMVVTMEPLGETRLKVTGTTALKMSSFGINPPSRLGFIKTGDDVKVSFEWIAGRQAMVSARTVGALISSGTNVTPQQPPASTLEEVLPPELPPQTSTLQPPSTAQVASRTPQPPLSTTQPPPTDGRINAGHWVVYQGEEGAGKGRHIVFVTGDEEYRSEEGMPMLARILAVRHGFKCTVLFPLNPADGTIDPNNQTNIVGLENLKLADMMVIFTRFRELPDDQMKYVVDFVNSGKPILGLRTATHAFDIKRNKQSRYAQWSWNNQQWPGGFGQQVLGETWVSHHGNHGKESTRGVINGALQKHPILRGVENIWGPTDVYRIIHLPKDAKVLVYGQVLKGMKPTDEPVAGAKNELMMPLTWIRSYAGEAGKSSPVICSTIGAAPDLESEGLRRLLVNACYWGLGLEDRIPSKSNVDYVGEFKPSFFGFGKFKRGVKPSDHELKSPFLPMKNAITLAPASEKLGEEIRDVVTTKQELTGPPVRVRLGTLAPKGSPSYKHLMAMGEKWRNTSGGRILLTIYADGTMGGESDMVRRMRIGQLQASILTAVGLTEIDTAMAGLQNLPMMFQSLEEVDYIGEKLRPMLEKQLLDKGFVVLFWGDAGWVRLFSKEPVIQPYDWIKTELFAWADSPAQADIYKSAGFDAVPLETGEILTRLQSGSITAVPTPPFVAFETQIDRLAPHMLDLNWTPSIVAGVMTKKTWDAVPASVQEALMKTAQGTGKLIKSDNRRENLEAVDAMKKRGLKVHSLTQETQAVWRQAFEAVYPKIRGRLVPTDIFDEVVKRTKEHRTSPTGTRK